MSETSFSSTSSSVPQDDHHDAVLVVSDNDDDDKLMMCLEEQNEEELMFAECSTSSFASTVVVGVYTPPKPQQPPLLEQRKHHDPILCYWNPSRCGMFGLMALLIIFGVTATTGLILLLQSRASNATPSCQLLSSSCHSNHDARMTTHPACALTEYEQLKTQLDSKEGYQDHIVESCQPANLALWQMAVELQQLKTARLTSSSNPRRVAASSSATALPSHPFDDNDNDNDNERNQALGTTTALMNRFVLYTLYFSTDTDTDMPATSVSTGAIDDLVDMCLWNGVVCNGQDHIMALDLADFQLGRGPLPTELGLLSSSLRVLDLGHNAFTGTVASELGQLTLLRTLSLEHNQLTGTIPAELGSLNQLRTLELGHNDFTGTLSNAAFQLGNLGRLSLASNKFHGRLPSSLKRSVFLQYVDVSDNQLTGTVDVYALFQSESLKFLDLSYNRQLDITSSPVALDIGYLSNLSTLHLSGIPVGKNSDIEQVLLSRFYLLPFLHDLRLADMGWQGSLPNSLFSKTGLTSVDLSDNSFTGTVLDSPSKITALLETLNLSNNLLSGSIPPMMASLKELWLQGNGFSGVLPNDVCQLVSVLEADFCHTDDGSPAGCSDDNDCHCFESC